MKELECKKGGAKREVCLNVYLIFMLYRYSVSYDVLMYTFRTLEVFLLMYQYML